MQADTEEMFQVWINAFKEEIGALMQLMLSSRSSSGLSLNSDSPRSTSRENTSKNSVDNSFSSKYGYPSNVDEYLVFLIDSLIFFFLQGKRAFDAE